MRAKGSEKEPLPQDEAERGGFHWRPGQVWGLAKATGKEWIEDKAPKNAAALAYYGLFALGPLILLAISIAGLVFTEAQARQAIVEPIRASIGGDAATAIDALVSGATQERGGVLGLVTSLVVLLVAAAAAFGHLKDALNTMWEVQVRPVTGGWKAKVAKAVRENALRFAGVLLVGLLLLATLVASSSVSALGRFSDGMLPGTEVVWQALALLVPAAVLTVAFALVFKFLPDTRVAWRDVWVGATVTGVLFSIGQWLIGLYVGKAALASRYGAAGAVIVLLVWAYYSAMIVFFGAEFTQVYANRYGSRVRPDRDARTVQSDVRERHDLPSEEGRRDADRARHRGRGSP